MNILFVVDKFPAVSETFVFNQVMALVDKGHDVKILTWVTGDFSAQESFVEYDFKGRTISIDKLAPASMAERVRGLMPFWKERISGVPVMLSPYYRTCALKLDLSYFVKAASDLLQQWQPQAVISHFGYNGLYVNALRRIGILRDDVKSLTFFHAYEICSRSVESVARRFGRIFDDNEVLLPISDYWRRKLIKAGAKPEQTHTLHMGVDVDRFAYKERPIKDDNINLLSVGRLVEKKGYEYSIEGVAKFKSLYPEFNVRYSIIGDGPEMPKLRQQVERLGLTDNVVFMGAQPQSVVVEAMDSANVFLLPSVTGKNGDMEGIPVSLMEAMAAGCPCISTRHSGIPELIADGVSGYLCDERNSSQIADKLYALSTLTPAQLAAMTQAARQKVESDFSSASLLDDLLHLLH